MPHTMPSTGKGVDIIIMRYLWPSLAFLMGQSSWHTQCEGFTSRVLLGHLWREWRSDDLGCRY